MLKIKNKITYKFDPTQEKDEISLEYKKLKLEVHRASHNFNNDEQSRKYNKLFKEYEKSVNDWFHACDLTKALFDYFDDTNTNSLRLIDKVLLSIYKYQYKEYKKGILDIRDDREVLLHKLSKFDEEQLEQVRKNEELANKLSNEWVSKHNKDTIKRSRKTARRIKNA